MSTRKDMMQVLLDGIVDIAYLTDMEGNFVYVNASVREYGFAPEELVGTNVLEIVCKEDRDKVVQSFARRKKGDTGVRLLHLHLLQKDGQAVPFEMKAKIVTFDNGSNGPSGSDSLENLSGKYVLGAARDISDRKQIEQALQEVKGIAGRHAPQKAATNDADGAGQQSEGLLVPGTRRQLTSTMAQAWATGEFETEILAGKNIGMEDKIRLTVGCSEVLLREVFSGGKLAAEDIERLTTLADNQIKLVKYLKEISGGVPALLNMLIGQPYAPCRHSARAGLYSALFITELSPKVIMVSRAQMSQVCTGALLHDIGKIALYPRLAQGDGNLSGQELNELREHPAAGARILQSANASKELQRIALQHHLVLNGAKVNSKDFDPFACIVCICNVFDNLTSTKPGRKPGKTYDALSIMVKNMRSDYFVPLLKTFIKLMGERA